MMCPDFPATRKSLLDVVRALIGVWRYQPKGKRLAIMARALADSFSDAVQAGIAAEADDIGRFWGMDVSLEIETR